MTLILRLIPFYVSGDADPPNSQINIVLQNGRDAVLGVRQN